ncbi:hypothetical protein ANN_02395 [Periplaneta americana]|uniref:Uncharacterized protein n=1 Tax=Periplaneta americana TaxID=6978 RepID=A0ABQ8U0D9_PERAM|nr:hypothetical protein ANN_02395 [Periplaneta americana]
MEHLLLTSGGRIKEESSEMFCVECGFVLGKNMDIISRSDVLRFERIPNLTGEQSDSITVFRIPPMASLMLHRCRTGAINLQRWWQSPSVAISESDWFLYSAGISRRITSCTVVSWRRHDSHRSFQQFCSLFRCNVTSLMPPDRLEIANTGVISNAFGVSYSFCVLRKAGKVPHIADRWQNCDPFSSCTPLRRVTLYMMCISGELCHVLGSTVLQHTSIEILKVFGCNLPKKLDCRKVRNVIDLRQRIVQTVELITPDMLVNIWRDVEYRFGTCQVINGAHVEVY